MPRPAPRRVAPVVALGAILVAAPAPAEVIRIDATSPGGAVFEGLVDGFPGIAPLDGVADIGGNTLGVGLKAGVTEERGIAELPLAALAGISALSISSAILRFNIDDVLSTFGPGTDFDGTASEVIGVTVYPANGAISLADFSNGAYPGSLGVTPGPGITDAAVSGSPLVFELDVTTALRDVMAASASHVGFVFATSDSPTGTSLDDLGAGGSGPPGIGGAALPYLVLTIAAVSTPTPAVTATPTSTPRPGLTSTPGRSITPTPLPSTSVTPTPASTGGPTPTPSLTATVSPPPPPPPSPSPGQPTPTPVATTTAPAETPGVSATPAPTGHPTGTPSGPPTPASSPVPTSSGPTPTPTPASSRTPVGSPASSPTATRTRAAATRTPGPSPTGTGTPGPVPTVERATIAPEAIGDQLLYFHDSRDDATTFLNLRNHGNAALEVRIAFYGPDIGEAFGHDLGIAAGATRTIDVTALRGGGLLPDHGIAVAAAVDALGQPVAAQALSGSFTVARVDRGAAWGAPAAARRAIEIVGGEARAAPAGAVVDGRRVQFRPIQPGALVLASFPDPSTLGSVDGRGGGQLVLVSFTDPTDGSFGLRPARITWDIARTLASGAPAADVEILSEGVRVEELSDVLGSQWPSSSGSLRLKPRPAAGSSRLAYFTMSLETFAAGFGLPPVERR